MLSKNYLTTNCRFQYIGLETSAVQKKELSNQEQRHSVVWRMTSMTKVWTLSCMRRAFITVHERCVSTSAVKAVGYIQNCYNLKAPHETTLTF